MAQTILVVDDDPVQRRLLETAIGRSGMQVVTAPGGQPALDLVNGPRGEQITLVLLDLVMPDMGGGELAEHLRELHPDLPILYMSGYTGTDVLRRGFDEQGVPFLQKPFSPGSLTAGIRRLLDGRAGRPVS